MIHKKRIEKLEQLSPQSDELPLVIYRIYEMDGTIRPGKATLFGVGDLNPVSDESYQDFLRRAYAMQAVGKHPDDMTEEELKVALAEADIALLTESRGSEVVGDQPSRQIGRRAK